MNNMYRIITPMKSLFKYSRYGNRFIQSTTNPAMITVAITGDVADKSRVKTIPLTPKEQIEDIVECYEAGATNVHCHVREYNEMSDKYEPTYKEEYTKEVLEGVKEKCPNMIFEGSIGNFGPSIEARGKFLSLNGLEMASLAVGSVNFKTSRKSASGYIEYINTNEEIHTYSKTMLKNKIKPNITIFDLSHLYYAAYLVEEQLIELPIKLMFVFGGHMSLPGDDKQLFEFFIQTSTKLFGKNNYIWSGVGVGWNHLTIQKWTLECGGHPRTGFEDTLMIERGIYAKNNSELVYKIAGLCKQFDRPVADYKQARQILYLDGKKVY
eukprot:225896_1